jgi:ubiquitin fusion degradation protein 1
VSNSTLESDIKVPAALNLPFGQLFFGFRVTAYTPPPTTTSSDSPAPPEPTSFSGPGHALSGRRDLPNASSNEKGKGKEKATSSEETSASWGTGRTLRPTTAHSGHSVIGEEARVRGPSPRHEAKRQLSYSPLPDWDDDDDDVIMVDSD